jgi:hypothetical protein
MKKTKSNKWTPKDVMGIINNPVYAFGILYEPQGELCEWIRAFNVSLPDSFWERTIEDQAAGYLSFLDWLVRNGFLIKERDDFPPLLPVEQWLVAQRKSTGEPMDYAALAKVAATKVFIEAGLTGLD